MKFLTPIALLFTFLNYAVVVADEDNCQGNSAGQIQNNEVQIGWMTPANNCNWDNFNFVSDLTQVLLDYAQDISITINFGSEASGTYDDPCVKCELDNLYSHLDCSHEEVRCEYNILSRSCDAQRRRQLRVGDNNNNMNQEERRLTGGRQPHLENLYCKEIIPKIKSFMATANHIGHSCRQTLSNNTDYVCRASFFQ